VPDEFFSNVARWMQDKHLDSVEVAGSPSAPAVFSLGRELDDFSEWALDTATDLRLKDFSIGVPQYLLARLSPEWIEAVESNLAVKVVGITDSDFQLIYTP
jgi:hypothetical protein